MPNPTEAVTSAMMKPGPSHELLLQLAHHLPSLVSLCNADGELVYLNPSGRKLIGVHDADLHSNRLTDYIVVGPHDDVTRDVSAIAREQGIWRGRMKLANASTGAQIEVERSTFCVHDSAGAITGYVSVMDVVADSRLVATQTANPVEQLVHDFTNMVASVLSGFSLIERRSQEPTIQAIAAHGKKAAEEGLAITQRLKAICK